MEGDCIRVAGPQLVNEVPVPDVLRGVNTSFAEHLRFTRDEYLKRFTAEESVDIERIQRSGWTTRVKLSWAG